MISTTLLRLIPKSVYSRRYSNAQAGVFARIRSEEGNSFDEKERGTSEFWRRKMRTLHKVLDVNKDGVISYDDFKLLADRFVRLGHLTQTQQSEFQEIIKNMWKNQWGCIDPYNLVTTEQYLLDMHHVINNPDRRQRVHHILPYIFKAVDKNTDGIISLPEYELFYKCVGLSSEDAAVSFRAIDMNNDGHLSENEFVDLGKEFFLTEDEGRPSKFFWGPLMTP